MRRGVEHEKRPIVPGATHTVVCTCGFASNAKAGSGADAIAQFIERHRHEGAAFTVEEMPK